MSVIHFLNHIYFNFILRIMKKQENILSLEKIQTLIAF